MKQGRDPLYLEVCRSQESTAPILLNTREFPLENFDGVGKSIVAKAALRYYSLLTPQR